MVDLMLIVEDHAQRVFISALIDRVAREHDVGVQAQVRIASGGAAGVLMEVQRLEQDIALGLISVPDILVVALDANCHGRAARRGEVDEAAADLAVDLVHAIPDPHIERWLLLDGQAFRAVLGRGCAAPDQKCERDRYKRLLADAVQQAGVRPLLGGVEYAADIAAEMDLNRAARADRGFAQFIDELRSSFRRGEMAARGP